MIAIAYSFGKPVITTDIGSIPEVVENGKRGYVVPPKDANALAEAIINVLDDDELIGQMEKNAYKKAQELSWDNIAKKILRFIEE